MWKQNGNNSARSNSGRFLRANKICPHLAKSYEGCGDPKWKGKFAMGNPSLHDTTIDWLSSLDSVFGSQAKTNDWIKRLAALKPLLPIRWYR